MRTGTVKFFNESKVTDSLQTKKQEKTFCSCFRNQRGRIARRWQLVKKKKEEKLLQSSSYLAKIYFFAYECLRRSDLLERFFQINKKKKKKRSINYYL
jgi:hypothetical protein